MKIVPTWKNAAYRQSLTGGTQALLPVNPIGEFELTDADLEVVHGASGCASGCGGYDNNSHNDRHNVLSGNHILNDNSVLDGVGILGRGSSSSYDGESGSRRGCQ